MVAKKKTAAKKAPKPKAPTAEKVVKPSATEKDLAMLRAATVKATNCDNAKDLAHNSMRTMKNPWILVIPSNGSLEGIDSKGVQHRIWPHP